MTLIRRLARLEEQKWQTLSEPQRYRHIALKLVDARYVLGKENLLATDCSGTLTLPLYALGYSIRMSADGLAEKVFTRQGSASEWQLRILACFYKKAGADKWSHVSPLVGRNVVLDAWDPVEPVVLKPLSSQQLFYKSMGYHFEVRELDPDRARAWSREDFAGELDRELVEVLG